MKKRVVSLLLALVLLCAPLSGCAAREAERYDVLASTAPVRAMTAALLEGTGLNCGLVVTESVSCLHDYTLTVAQMEKIGQADVVVLNGLGLEEFMEDALRTAKRTITASTGVDTLPGEDVEDPHIWLDPANCILMCKNIAAGLAEFYPDKQPLIEQNLSAVTAEYEAAQTYGEETLKALSCRELVTFHDGFSYFADAFSLTIAAAMEVESGSEPSAKELEEIISIVEENQIPAVFTEVNGETGAAEVVAGEAGCAVRTLDMAISNRDYFAAMRQNIDIVKEALG